MGGEANLTLVLAIFKNKTASGNYLVRCDGCLDGDVPEVPGHQGHYFGDAGGAARHQYLLDGRLVLGRVKGIQRPGGRVTGGALRPQM